MKLSLTVKISSIYTRTGIHLRTICVDIRIALKA